MSLRQSRVQHFYISARSMLIATKPSEFPKWKPDFWPMRVPRKPVCRKAKTDRYVIVECKVADIIPKFSTTQSHFVVKIIGAHKERLNKYNMSSKNKKCNSRDCFISISDNRWSVRHTANFPSLVSPPVLVLSLLKGTQDWEFLASILKFVLFLC